ncbi:MAG TPA: septum formation protein Maf [candidate division WOR-3 bacterium]|uniref:dTTP/UTP pyrophosphatase n=1 Tax=candidate division WOR-3 bacterium TaxID=2052148 RepID=A0A7C5HNT5_UNCW3|nr:septum formation protein Maf [candidate division WOR-3 bacterium]
MKVMLASGSPRRINILKKLGVDFVVRKVNIDEKIFESPDYTVIYNAQKKVEEASKEMMPEDIVIGFDTIVYLNRKIIGKPRDREEAFKILSKLSGKTHKVFTGIAIKYNMDLISDFDVSSVTFKKLMDTEILEYINSGEPFDKAGAYGVQGKAVSFIEKIEGSYTNVVGLPVEKLQNLLGKLGVHIEGKGVLE